MDVDPSFLYLIFTLSHNNTFKECLADEPMYSYWKRFQRDSTHCYNRWFRYWLNLAENTDKVVYFFRFEDVLTNPREVLTELFQFILGLESLEGTVMEQRIEECLKMGVKKNQAYKPRQGGANKNLKNFR